MERLAKSAHQGLLVPLAAQEPQDILEDLVHLVRLEELVPLVTQASQDMGDPKVREIMISQCI